MEATKAVWVRDNTSIGSVLPSSRSVIEGTTRTQRTSHTSNGLAYSRSDASSQSRGAGTASSVKGAVARQGRELSLLKGAVHSDCLYWHGDRRATPLVSNKMAVWVRDSPACEIMKSCGIANLVLEQELL